MTERIGDWIQTYSGRCFWPLSPRAEDVYVEDIAHALSMKCRFSGHSTRFYSVAEHSVLVSQNVPEEYALWGLLHDAAEAYSADVPRPLKRFMKEWAPIESNIMRAICERFGLPLEEPREVKTADYAMLADERAALMNSCDREWTDTPDPLGAEIRAFDPGDAKIAFMRRFSELMPMWSKG